MSPPALSPQGPHPMSPCSCYPWHLRDKVTPDDWWHRSTQGWAAICNITDMLCAFCMVLKAMSVQSCQVAGWISSNIMKYIIKVLVNKANVLSSRNHTMDLEIRKSLRWINGSFISRVEDNLTEIGGPLFEELYMILQPLKHIMTSCGRHSLLLRDFIGTLKDLIVALYRCHFCHLWALPVGLP